MVNFLTRIGLTQEKTNPENSRRSDFKKGIDAMDGRRRRCETFISIRKNKKEEGLAKRRNMNMLVPSLPAMPWATNDGSTA